MNVVNLLKRIVGLAHVHCWETTHTNGFMHPTIQKCRCGMTRKVDWCGPTMHHSDWVYSDGTRSGRELGADKDFDWGNHHGFGSQRRLKPNGES